MPLDRWRHIEDLFHAALEQQAEARLTFLDNACPGDEDLRREVQSLLDQEDKTGKLLSAPLDRVAAEMIDPGVSVVRFSIGSMIGPYRIVAPLGASGMGEVYRARDTRLDRTVAIKILKERFTERFGREARAISALNHPHICTLYDIGSLEGAGYLVMECVDGEPLI